MRNLELCGVSQRYGSRTVLRDITLSLKAGSCTMLYGSNGAGKSTVLRLAAGRERPSAGCVELDGRLVREEDVYSRTRIAAVLGPPACYPDLTVEEHFLLIATSHGSRDAPKVAQSIVDQLGLATHSDSLPFQLSAGLMQLVALGSALARPREVLLLDEPEQHLDVSRRQSLIEWVAEDLRAGVAVMIATHDPQLVAALADDVAVLEEGHLVARGRPADLVQRGGAAHCIFCGQTR